MQYFDEEVARLAEVEADVCGRQTTRVVDELCDAKGSVGIEALLDDELDALLEVLVEDRDCLREKLSAVFLLTDSAWGIVGWKSVLGVICCRVFSSVLF